MADTQTFQDYYVELTKKIYTAMTDDVIGLIKSTRDIESQMLQRILENPPINVLTPAPFIDVLPHVQPPPLSPPPPPPPPQTVITDPLVPPTPGQ
jgi:hypothetical protein